MRFELETLDLMQGSDTIVTKRLTCSYKDPKFLNILLVYVDDVIITRSSQSLIQVVTHKNFNLL